MIGMIINSNITHFLREFKYVGNMQVLINLFSNINTSTFTYVCSNIGMYLRMYESMYVTIYVSRYVCIYAYFVSNFTV